MSSKKFLLDQAVITRLDDKLSTEGKKKEKKEKKKERRCASSPFIFSFSHSPFLLFPFLFSSAVSRSTLRREGSIRFLPCPVCISRLLALRSNITPFFSIIRKLSTRHVQANGGSRYRQNRRTLNFLTLGKDIWEEYIARRNCYSRPADKRPPKDYYLPSVRAIQKEKHGSINRNIFAAR